MHTNQHKVTKTQQLVNKRKSEIKCLGPSLPRMRWNL